jgi:hypothetical protein
MGNEQSRYEGLARADQRELLVAFRDRLRAMMRTDSGSIGRR